MPPHAILLNPTRRSQGRLKKLSPKANSQRSSAGSAPAAPHRFAADLEMIEISSANSSENLTSQHDHLMSLSGEGPIRRVFQVP
jgi:hypothetical protein